MEAFYYKLYGSRIRSNILLGSLPQCQPGRSRFTFEVARRRPQSAAPTWFHQIYGDDQEIWTSYGRRANFDVLRFHEECDFEISKGGRMIKCYPLKDLSLEHLQAYFLTQAMPIALNLAGEFVLHASAVRVGPSSIAFAGPQGAGKSTLASTFVNHGYDLVSDDTIPLKFCQKSVYLTPSFPELRLAKASRKKVLDEKFWEDSTDAGIKQRANVKGHFVSHPLPLAAVFLLQNDEQQHKSVQIKKLTVSEALPALLGNCWRFHVTRKKHLKKEMELLSKLLERVPIYSLAYFRSYAKLPKVMRAVIEESTAK